MKCLACDCILSDREATRKYTGSTEFIDLCDHCVTYTEILTDDHSMSEVQEETGGIQLDNRDDGMSLG